MIQAIQTKYNGYLFRSRLEARWAVFFDNAGIQYEYEPEGFEVELEDATIKYLPDFYLPKDGLYCEVKPSLDALKEEQEKLSWMVDFNGPMSDGLIILGQIPFIENHREAPCFIKYYWDKGVMAEEVTFVPGGVVGSQIDAFADSDNCTTAPDLPVPGHFSEEDWSRLYQPGGFLKVIDGNLWLLWNDDIVCKAYAKARSARFEHGETPIPVGH